MMQENGRTNLNVHAMIIGPSDFSREGLRHMLLDAQCQVVWCNDAPPAAPLSSLAGCQSLLVIVSTEIDEAIGHIADVRTQYPSARIALLMEPVWKQQDLVGLRSCDADTVIAKNVSHHAFIRTLRLVLNRSTGLLSGLRTHSGIPVSSGEPMILTGVKSEILAGDEILSGERESHPGCGTQTLMDAPPQPQDYGLSVREMAVLMGLREGQPNKEIARGLGITEATVKVHVKAILRKARVRNRTQVALWAAELGIGQAHRGTTLGSVREAAFAGIRALAA
jgi:two-component system, NarL family, nitrate/nitrite response regulator NarL